MARGDVRIYIDGKALLDAIQKEGATMTSPTPVDPVPPVVPPMWSVQTIITYVSSFALFIVGLLTLGGVVIPASVSADIQLYTGLAMTAAGPLVTLVALISKNHLIRDLVTAGVSVEVARKV